jgi:hypothetical protein
MVYTEWMRRRLIVSTFFLHRQHQLAKEKAHLLRLSIVRILPFAAVREEKAMQGGAFTFQILFLENEQCPPECNIL